MTTKSKVAGLLKRYQFIDFAQVVATEPNFREDALRNYLDRERKGRWASYKGLRSLVPDIAGVRRGLDMTASLSKQEVHRGLKAICHPEDLGFNTEAADVLFDLVRDGKDTAYDDHPRSSLQIGPDRKILMGVEHYVVENETGAFRWVYPRRDRLDGNAARIAMSLIHHNYVRGDFADFKVQMVDLSCEPRIGPRGGATFAPNRSPHITELGADEIMPRRELNEQANHIYSLLQRIAEGL